MIKINHSLDISMLSKVPLHQLSVCVPFSGWDFLWPKKKRFFPPFSRKEIKFIQFGIVFSISGHHGHPAISSTIVGGKV
jgi:hypothetical protein